MKLDTTHKKVTVFKLDMDFGKLLKIGLFEVNALPELPKAIYVFIFKGVNAEGNQDPGIIKCPKSFEKKLEAMSEKYGSFFIMNQVKELVPVSFSGVLRTELY